MGGVSRGLLTTVSVGHARVREAVQGGEQQVAFRAIESRMAEAKPPHPWKNQCRAAAELGSN